MNRQNLKLLKELALQDSRKRNPTFPEYARSTKAYTDKDANGLTRCIIDFLKFSGWQAERISVTGRYQAGKVFEGVHGNLIQTKGSYIKSSMQRGSADISAIINGKSVKFEVKIGKDKQSEYQKAYEEQVKKAGGMYFIVHDFDEFIEIYDKYFK